MPDRSVLVLCPSGSDPSRIILGLSVGERLLLALAHSGFRRVAFAGDGPKPASQRAEIQVVPVASLAEDRAVVVTISDVVFDRRLLAGSTLASELPLRSIAGNEAVDWATDPTATARRLGQGRAESGNGFAIRILDGHAAKAAHRSLLLSLRKPIDGWISQHLNRHVSTFITQYLVKTGLSPNVFTVLFLGVGLLAAWFAAQGGPWWVLVVAGLLFQGQSILDGCDGEIARLTYRFSRLGQWLDSVGDDITNYAFCFGLAVGQAKVHGAPWILWLGIVTLTAQAVVTVVLYRRLILLGTGDLLAIPDLTTTGAKDTLAGRALAKGRVMTKRDVFVFIIATFTVLQLPLVGFLLYAAGTFPTVVAVIANDRRIAQRSTT